MAVVPRPRAAIEDDLRNIPALRAASSGDPDIDLARQDIIASRANRLLEEMLPGVPADVHAYWTAWADRLLAALP